MEWAVSIPPLGTRQLCTPLAVSARAADFVLIFVVFFAIESVQHLFSFRVCVCVLRISCAKREGRKGVRECVLFVFFFVIAVVVVVVSEALPKLTVRRTRPLSSSRRRVSAESRDVVAMRMP